MKIGQCVYPYKCYRTQVINIITSLCVDILDEKRQGDNSTEKGKRGDLSPREYFINISKKVKVWIFIYPKFPRDENDSLSG
jgi:hypothetical protein